MPKVPKQRVFTRCPISGDAMPTLMLMTPKEFARFISKKGEVFVPCPTCMAHAGFRSRSGWRRMRRRRPTNPNESMVSVQAHRIATANWSLSLYPRPLTFSIVSAPSFLRTFRPTTLI